MSGEERTDRPNIVVLLADDMGFGDVGAFNPGSLVPTPNMDRLAAEAMSFGDAHSSSAVCSPSRYSLLTGRYCWRSALKSGVFFGYEQPIIERDRITLPRFLQGLGYRTGAVGKWHLGLQYHPLSGSDIDLTRPLPWPEATRVLEAQIDFGHPVGGGPLELGFDEFFGTSGCPTCQPPYGFIEGDRFIDPPRVYDGSPPYTGRPGMASPGWRHAEADPQILDRACDFITSGAKRDGPFFAYVALDAPHEPCTLEVVPAIARGRSRAGPRGDLVWFVDHAAGRLRRALEDAGVWDNTIFVVTSDNGALPGDRVIDDAGVEVYRTYGHLSSGPWRGYKAHIWEGGHREPLIISWPGRVDAGRRSQEMVCLMDLFATLAEILGAPAPVDAEDSVSFAGLLLGHGAGGWRRSLVHHSQRGVFALRLGPTKLVLGTKGSGGWPPPSGGGPEPGAPGQLYDLSEDPGETEDLWTARPRLVVEMSEALAELTREGRTDL
jgi:arylsulfatase A-like enzyme